MSNSAERGSYPEFWQRFQEEIAQRPDSPLYFDSDELENSYLSQKQNLPEYINYTFASNSNQEYLQVKFHIHDARDDRDEIYAFLVDHRVDIQSEIGEVLDWSRNESLKAYDPIYLQRDGNVISNPDEWDEYISWFIEYGELFHEVFGSYLQQYNRS